MTTGKHTLYNDETQDIPWTEQIAIFVAFEHRYRISEHYIVILPISELVGSHLSAPNKQLLSSKQAPATNEYIIER